MFNRFTDPCGFTKNSNNEKFTPHGAHDIEKPCMNPKSGWKLTILIDNVV